MREFGAESDVFAYVASIWPPVAVATVAVAVVQYRLYDIQLAIRRVVIYGIMALILTVVFAAGARSEPLRSLARLDALVSAGTDDEHTIYLTITETVAEAVRAPGVVLAMHPGPVMESPALSGAESPHALVVPLLHRSERLGELRFSPRTPGESYGRADRALLDQLASQAAALVHGLRRDRDIATLREDAIEAMAAQRTALGRDLHDGLAPLLAGAGLTADALRRGMPERSPDAEEAGRLATRLRNAASEVRQIAHVLQPTGVGTDGLAGRIEDYVASHAAHAEVSLRTAGEAVELVVSDDGRGIVQPYVSGWSSGSRRSRSRR